MTFGADASIACWTQPSSARTPLWTSSGPDVLVDDRLPDLVLVEEGEALDVAHHLGERLREGREIEDRADRRLRSRKTSCSEKIVFPVPGCPITMLIEFCGKPPLRMTSRRPAGFRCSLAVMRCACPAAGRGSPAAPARSIGSACEHRATRLVRSSGFSRKASAPDWRARSRAASMLITSTGTTLGGGIALERPAQRGAASRRGIKISVMSAQGGDRRTRSSAE